MSCSMVNFTFTLTLPSSLKAVSWLRRWIVGLSPRRSGFDLRSVDLRFVVDKMALEKVYLSRNWMASIPPIHHTHLHLNIALTWRRNGTGPGNLPKSHAVSENRGAMGRTLLSLLLVLRVEKDKYQLLLTNPTQIIVTPHVQDHHFVSELICTQKLTPKTLFPNLFPADVTINVIFNSVVRFRWSRKGSRHVVLDPPPLPTNGCINWNVTLSVWWPLQGSLFTFMDKTTHFSHLVVKATRPALGHTQPLIFPQRENVTSPP